MTRQQIIEPIKKSFEHIVKAVATYSVNPKRKSKTEEKKKPKSK